MNRDGLQYVTYMRFTFVIFTKIHWKASCGHYISVFLDIFNFCNNYMGLHQFVRPSEEKNMNSW